MWTKVVEKVTGTMVPYLYTISFTIEYECKELMKSEVHLPKKKKSKVDNFSHTDQNKKIGQHFKCVHI